ncbi:hypothetical protein [Natrinema halophilum]|uniref:Uncharacterized protein n=1 Tax=Natrinema halophilum TaxID=1699371 RepID=A0A7D5H640_9EURY|nr:hypothetical protein [Natrinema halophilum]QLG48455.1 hypothetical protein HYG82_06135 [Natrinema halophilum]
MSADERPTMPVELERPERDAIRELEDRDPATLRAAGRYLTALGSWKERRDTDRDGAESTPVDAESDEFPDEVPERASVSVTEIGGTEYCYYQWREGDEIRSETVRR